MSAKTVLVTGASRGIGKAIALRFARESYNVAITCIRNTDRLLATKAEIDALAPRCLAYTGDRGDKLAPHCPAYTDDRGDKLASRCLAYTGDMGDRACCEELFAQIRDNFGHVDVLVNNAGISYVGLLQDMTWEEWDRLIRTNLTAVFHLCKLAIPDMVSRKAGNIINISSVWGNVGASCEVAYSASKGAVNAFTRALAKELAPSHIQVNAIACGAIDTEMNHFLEPEELSALTSQIPVGRLGRPEEVAELVWQLAQNNTYLTGQVIGLDGGWI